MTRDQMHAAGGAFVTGQMSKESTEKPSQARKPRSTLTQAEDFKLTMWMHQRTPKWGEKAVDICAEAVLELGMPQLNKDHIYTRLAAHADTLPKASPPIEPASIEARLLDAERFNVIVYESLFNGRTVSPEDGAWASGYIAATRTRLKAS